MIQDARAKLLADDYRWNPEIEYWEWFSTISGGWTASIPLAECNHDEGLAVIRQARWVKVHDYREDV